MDDPDLAFDLRHLNKGRPGDTFKIFFEKLEKLISEVTAEDDRRNNIAHMSTFISIRFVIVFLNNSFHAALKLIKHIVES